MFSHNRTALIALGLALVTLLIAGCAGFQQFDTGLPASSAKKFFFHMENEALEHGYSTTRSLDDTSISIEADRGELEYNVAGDEILLTVQVYSTDAMTEDDIHALVYELKDLSDILIDGATERAERASAFE